MPEKEYIEIITSVNGENKVEQLNKKVDNLGNEAKETNIEVNKFDNTVKRTVNGTNSLKDKVNRLTNSLKSLKKENDETSTSLVNTIKKYAGITAIVAGVKRATTVYTAFDDEVRKVQATSGATAEEMEKLRDQAKELGRTTRWSASEAAQAQFEFAKAGFAANEIYKATPGILYTATAGQLDLAEATEITAGVLRMFKLNAAESQRVGDALAMTANSSTTDIRGLGESLKYAGLGATDFGLSLEQTLAILGTLGNNKIDNSMAGTGLRSVFSAFKDKNKAKLLINAGIQLTEDGKYRNFLKILDDIKKKTENMAPAQKQSFMRDVFGEQGELVMSALFKTTQKDFDDLLNKIENSKGYAQKVAEIYDGGIGGAFKNLQSAIEGVSISFIEILAPSFVTITNVVTETINIVTSFFEWLNSGSTLANTLMFAITTLTTSLVTYKGIMLTIKAVNFMVAASTVALTAVKKGLAAAYLVSTLAGGGFAGILAVINGLLLPFTGTVALVIGAVVGLAAGFVFLYKKSETFRNSVTWLIDKLKSLWNWIQKFETVGAVIDAGKNVLNKTKEFFGFGSEKIEEESKKQGVSQGKARGKGQIEGFTTVVNEETQKLPTGINTDYLLLGDTKDKSSHRSNDIYKHNGYYLKGTKLINNSTNSNQSNVYSESYSNENSIQEKTVGERILETLIAIKNNLKSSNEGSKIEFNISKNDKEDIINEVVKDLVIALDNI